MSNTLDQMPVDKTWSPTESSLAWVSSVSGEKGKDLLSPSPLGRPDTQAKSSRKMKPEVQ